MPRDRSSRRCAVLVAASAVATTLLTPGQAGAAAADGPFVTLLFSRTEVGLAAGCLPDDRGVARLATVVAPYLAARGMRGTGTLVTDRTQEESPTCTHERESMTASWADASALADDYGWSFVSQTATYPHLATLSPEQELAETCGSARTIDGHGLPGGHGMVAYPGKQGPPEALQAEYGATCFAWGRRYGGQATTDASAGRTAPFWQNTGAVNGGPCNVLTAPCAKVAASGSSRYLLPKVYAGRISRLVPGQWLTLQAYVLVPGRSPADTTSTARWDCTSPDPARHWTNDNERYCYRDYQTIIAALAAVPGLRVTDPLTVGVAFGRPATY